MLSTLSAKSHTFALHATLVNAFHHICKVSQTVYGLRTPVSTGAFLLILFLVISILLLLFYFSFSFYFWSMHTSKPYTLDWLPARNHSTHNLYMHAVQTQVECKEIALNSYLPLIFIDNIDIVQFTILIRNYLLL